MPIIKITAADIAKGKTLPEGWYGVEIVKVSDFVASSKGDSSNVIITFKVDGDDGKEIDRYYSTKALGMFNPLIEAITGKKTPPGIDFDLDTDMFKGKKVDNKILVSTYEGRMKNEISDQFLPYGQGKNQKAPF